MDQVKINDLKQRIHKKEDIINAQENWGILYYYIIFIFIAIICLHLNQDTMEHFS